MQSEQAAMPASAGQDQLSALAERYRRNPDDKATIVAYANALRSMGQSGQAAAVIEAGMARYGGDPDIAIAYAKALSEQGRFEQALQVLDNAIRPEQPNWNALLVKGATLDQMGRNAEARAIYGQALTLAPGEASVEANWGLSFAMTNDLQAAETHLRRAVQMRGATSKIRQNLALVVGLQGRFDEARALYAAELPPEEVERNMTALRGMLSQQNRWDAVERQG